MVTVCPTVETVTVATAITLPVETETVGPIGQTVTAAMVPTIIAEPETEATETAADVEAV
jgi:hypothetical protein